MELFSSISSIKGVGEKTEKLFNKLNIFEINDLIDHYPSRYEEYQEIIPIYEAKEGEVVSIEAIVFKNVEIRKIKNLQIIECLVKDFSGVILLKWFNMPFLRNTLRIGYRYIFRGKVIYKDNQRIIEQPQILTREEFENKLKVLQPIYPLTEGLTNNAVSKAIKQIFEKLPLKNDYIPEKIRKEYNLCEYNFAINQIHFPKDRDNLIKARNRLIFDEFFIFLLTLRKLKENKELLSNNYKMNICKETTDFINSLPYSLTNSQLRVWNEISKDLSNEIIMNRLIQGDVGSGKTVIAALALLQTIKNGYQGAIMVPTEVLAKQHFHSLTSQLKNYGANIVLLVGSMTAKEKKNAYQLIESNEANIIVGTHALIQEKVVYNNLALVITDEQHRFGVRQREALSKKGIEPHILVMSATPIPRTLAVILYGDLDISVIDELPAKRLPIKNCVVDTNYRKTAYKFIEKEVMENRQVYIICPMVEESENIEAENVIEYTQRLKESMMPLINVEYLHGKMKPKEKNEIMERFSNNEIHILVSTTVVEVGINVPNATVMMVENAEKFGLAQLHQLRGRVGRGDKQSYCIFVSSTSNKETKQRLEILNKSNDGFYIANEDLKLRGSGDLFGIRQSGLMEFKIGDVLSDVNMLKLASEAVTKLIEEDYNLEKDENIHLKTKLEKYLVDGLSKLNI